MKELDWWSTKDSFGLNTTLWMNLMSALHIFGFEGTNHQLLERLVRKCQKQFELFFSSVHLYSEKLAIPEGAYDAERDQYFGPPFLAVAGGKVPPREHALGIVDLDLFVPPLNFIFGLAQRGGHALVALPRLRQSFYGLCENENLFFERTTKEVFHELGHVLGLNHCSNYCVMRFSNSLSDTDKKPATYCTECLQRLK